MKFRRTTPVEIAQAWAGLCTEIANDPGSVLPDAEPSPKLSAWNWLYDLVYRATKDPAFNKTFVIGADGYDNQGMEFRFCDCQTLHGDDPPEYDDMNLPGDDCDLCDSLGIHRVLRLSSRANLPPILLDPWEDVEMTDQWR